VCVSVCLCTSVYVPLLLYVYVCDCDCIWCLLCVFMYVCMCVCMYVQAALRPQWSRISSPLVVGLQQRWLSGGGGIVHFPLADIGEGIKVSVFF